MRNHRVLSGIMAALLLVTATWAGPPNPVPATADKAGSISALLPVASIVRGPAKQPVTAVAKKGDDVIWNDLVRTDKGGRARITLLDQSILSVGSQAEMRILKHDPKSQQTSIEVNYGRVRADVAPVTKQGGSFEVKTPTAVAGVIGTVFGIDSVIGSTTFLCLSGTVMVGSSDPNIPGRVPCTEGMVAVVSAGKPATTRPATQQEIQQFIQATEPAVISAMNPSSVLPGTTTDATITGTQLDDVNAVSSSNSSVTATLNPGGTAGSLGVHLVVAANAAPGPVTLTFSKPSGVASAAVFSILAPPQAAAAGGDYKAPYLNTIEQERQSALSGLNGLGVGLAQSADQAYNQISAANSALTAPMDISQAATDLKGPVNTEMGSATNQGTLINQAAQTASANFTNLYNSAMQALLARNPSGTPDNQFQTDLTNAFNQVNATLLAAFAASQADLGQQATTQNAAIQTITQNWLAKITQTQQAQAPPSVKALSTNAAPTSGGVPVTITGTNFDPNTKVLFGGVPASNVTVVSDSQLTVVTPPGNPGTVDLTIITGTGETVTVSGGFSFGGPVAAVNPPDVTVNPLAAINLDGSRSSDTLAGTTLTYSWTLCSLGFKPPQVGASLPSLNAPICTAAPGTLTITDSQFSTTAPTTPGQYFARLQVTDNLGMSAVIYSSVNVTQPTYDDPLTRMNSLVAAFSSLQSSSLTNFFDPGFPNLIGFQQSLQAAFLTYQSMVVNLQGPLATTSGNLSTIVANWQLVYTIKNDPACANASTGCQPPSYTSNIGSVTAVWTLTPGKGWFVTDLRFPNGFPQGTLPAVPPVNTSQPDLELTSVSGSAPGNPIPVGTGQQTFFATVKNIGTAASLATPVEFILTNPQTGAQLGKSNPNPMVSALAVGSSIQVSAAINIDPTVVTQVTNAQLNVTVNPGCQVAESTCSNNAGTFSVVITPPNVPLPDLRVTTLTLSGQPPQQTISVGNGPQTFAATVQNIGNAAFTAATTVHFVLVAGSTTVAQDAALPVPLAAGSSEPVTATLTIPNTIPAGTLGTVSADASPTCPLIVEPDCTNNTLSVAVNIGIIDLAVTNIAPPAGRDLTAAPWLSGEPLNFSVTVASTATSTVPSAGGEAVSLSLNGVVVARTVAPALQPGASAVLPMHAVALDPVATGGATLAAAIAPDPGGDANPANNTFTLNINTSDWQLNVTGAGTSASPLIIPMIAPECAMTTVQPAAASGPNPTVNLVAAQVSSHLSEAIGANASCGPVPTTPGSVITVSADATAGIGQYFAQVIGEFLDPQNGNRVTAQRGAVILVGVGSFIAPAVGVTVNSSAGNSAPGTTSCSSANPVACSVLQLNGPLEQAMTLTPVRSDGLTAGTTDLVMAEPTSITATPQQLPAVPIGSAGGPVAFNAFIDSSGNITTGAAQVIVSATAVQGVPVGAARVTLPPVGSEQTTLFFNIGDIFLSAPQSCIQVLPGRTATVSFSITTNNTGFNLPSVTWQWSGLPAGLSVGQVTGTASLSGGVYSLPSYTFTNSNTADIAGLQAALFVVTITSPQNGSSASKAFPVGFDLSSTACTSIIGGARISGGSILNGTWTRGGAPGGMAKATTLQPAATGPLPDLQISGGSVSYTPSMPKAGDTVAVRFRLTNAGSANAVRVPVSLVVNGTAVVSDAFDVRAGSSTLGGLEWVGARAPTPGTLQAAVVVDPGHTVPQKSTMAKSVPLVHFALLGGTTAAGLGTAAQRSVLEIADGACLGFRFASGAGSACGGADVEVSAEDGGRFMLAAQNGIADLGPAFGSANVAGVHYGMQAAAVAGHAYAVQLAGGKTGILRVIAIRNPGQLAAKGRQAFGRNAPRPMGAETNGPVETGDVSGVRPHNQTKAVLDVSYQLQ